MDSKNSEQDQTLRPCLFACQDQQYKTAVTTSTFPNMHTFLRGPEFCLMFRKVQSNKIYLTSIEKFSIALIPEQK